VDGKTTATIAGITFALLATIPLPIYVTRRRLRNEWARYEAAQAKRATAGDAADTAARKSSAEEGSTRD